MKVEFKQNTKLVEIKTLRIGEWFMWPGSDTHNEPCFKESNNKYGLMRDWGISFGTMVPNGKVIPVRVTAVTVEKIGK